MNEDNKDIPSLEDTDRIQRAIEVAVDEDTAGLPLLADINLEDVNEDVKVAEVAAESAIETNLGIAPERPLGDVPVRSWFFTFMCMNVPIVGWFYLFYLAFNKKNTGRRSFARAYLYYKFLFFVIAAVILGVLVYIGMGVLDQVLAYMEML